MIKRLRIEEIFVIFCGFLFVVIQTENCAYAPTCPDISTWKPGFICENNFIAIIKTRFIDGLRKKTICCRAINICNKQFWCKPHSNVNVLKENSSLPMRTSCASGCAPVWKNFNISDSILLDGVRAGSFSPGISSFIGRVLINGELQIGRIQISHPTGLFYTFDGSVRFTNSSIEYLANLNYIWKNSSHGALVKNAVTVTASKNLPFYIGRIQINGFTYVGTVVRVLGLLYYDDENGIERTADCYEVLTCGDENEVAEGQIGDTEGLSSIDYTSHVKESTTELIESGLMNFTTESGELIEISGNFIDGSQNFSHFVENSTENFENSTENSENLGEGSENLENFENSENSEQSTESTENLATVSGESTDLAISSESEETTNSKESIESIDLVTAINTSDSSPSFTPTILMESTTLSASTVSDSPSQTVQTSNSTSHFIHLALSVSTDQPISSTTKPSNNMENSSNVPSFVEESVTILGSNSGYSYVPPSLPFSSSTEQSEDNLSTIVSSESSSPSISTSSSLVTVTTVYPHKPSISTLNAAAFSSTESTIPSTGSSSSSQSHLSQNSSTMHFLQSSSSTLSTTAEQFPTKNPIPMHSWTQVPPLSLNGYLLSTLMSSSFHSMSQLSLSTEKVSTTATTENPPHYNETHNVNASEHNAIQQLTTNTEHNGDEDVENVDGNGENLGEGWGVTNAYLGLNESGIGESSGVSDIEKPTDISTGFIEGEKEENSQQINGQIGIENEGNMEGLGVNVDGGNFNQVAVTEGSEEGSGQINAHSTTMTNLAPHFTPKPGEMAITQSTSSTKTDETTTFSTSTAVEQATSKTTKTRRTTTKTPEIMNLSTISTQFLLTSTETSELTSPGDTHSTSTEIDDLESSSDITAVFPENSANGEEISSSTQEIFSQTTEEATKPTKFTTSRTKPTKTTTKTSKPVISIQNYTPAAYFSLTSTKKPTTVSYSSSTNLPGMTTESTETIKSTTNPAKDSTTTNKKPTATTSKFSSITTTKKYTAPPTTSRTTRTTRRFSRRTTTKKSSINGNQDKDTSSPGWLFTTAKTTESLPEDHSSVDREDVVTDISTEEAIVTEAGEKFECVPRWKQLPSKTSFLFDGIEINSQNSNHLSYIGRININNSYIIGRIDLKSADLAAFSFYHNNSNQISTADTISYLSRTQLQSYSWKISSKGLAVKNAISINQSGNWPFYIGKINSNGVIIIGKVLPSIGLAYADKYGNERITKAYEVLTCEAMINDGGGCGV